MRLSCLAKVVPLYCLGPEFFRGRCNARAAKQLAMAALAAGAAQPAEQRLG